MYKDPARVCKDFIEISDLSKADVYCPEDPYEIFTYTLGSFMHSLCHECHIDKRNPKIYCGKMRISGLL